MKTPDHPFKSGFYVGDVWHNRLNPKVHQLRYRSFQLYYDLDEADAIFSRLKVISRGRFGLMSVCDRDFGPDPKEKAKPLRARLIALLKAHDLYEDGFRLFHLCMPRIMGFVFNPISLYFVMNAEGVPKAMLYEVNNTFGDRHTYVIRAGGLWPIEQSCSKRLHVSPFMLTHDHQYQFQIAPPSDRFRMLITLLAPDQAVMLKAGFAGQYAALSDRTAWRLFWSVPLLTLKVVAAIHYEAIKLIFKGLWLKPKPITPKSSVSSN